MQKIAYNNLSKQHQKLFRCTLDEMASCLRAIYIGIVMISLDPLALLIMVECYSVFKILSCLRPSAYLWSAWPSTPLDVVKCILKPASPFLVAPLTLPLHPRQKKFADGHPTLPASQGWHDRILGPYAADNSCYQSLANGSNSRTLKRLSFNEPS